MNSIVTSYLVGTVTIHFEEPMPIYFMDMLFLIECISDRLALHSKNIK